LQTIICRIVSFCQKTANFRQKIHKLDENLKNRTSVFAEMAFFPRGKYYLQKVILKIEHFYFAKKYVMRKSQQ